MENDVVSSVVQSKNVLSHDVAMPLVLDLESLEHVLGMSFPQVMRNAHVLKAAQSYLLLRQDLAGEAEKKSLDCSYSISSELGQVEKGVSILCAAYMQGVETSNAEVCADIEGEVASLSGFYQKQVAEAYFSACNIVFDATDAAERPDLMKQLVSWRDSLQKLHFAWPTDTDESNMPRFNEKVDTYGRQLGIEGRVFPEWKKSFNSILPSAVMIKERCA